MRRCPRFTRVLNNAILKVVALYFALINICLLLQGGPDISNNVNSLTFKAIQEFIAQSGRFAME